MNVTTKQNIRNLSLVEIQDYLVRISEVDDEEIFKNCLEFWHFFSKEIYSQEMNIFKRNNPNNN